MKQKSTIHCLAAWGIRSESVFPVLKCVFSQPCYLPIKLPEVSQQTISQPLYQTSSVSPVSSPSSSSASLPTLLTSPPISFNSLLLFFSIYSIVGIYWNAKTDDNGSHHSMTYHVVFEKGTVFFGLNICHFLITSGLQLDHCLHFLRQIFSPQSSYFTA